MRELQPVSIPLPPTAPDDPRVGRLLGQDLSSADEASVVLIGFPTDEGVKRNVGRPGAAQAPDAIRRQLFKLTPDPERFGAFTSLLRRTADLGNLTTTDDLENDQHALGETLAPHLARGAIGIILGGGHETAYGHFLGYALQQRPVSILNWDAHADVRPLIQGKAHSGSPFRQALEHPSQLCQRYQVGGLNPATVAKSHLEYITQRQGSCTFNHQIDRESIARLYGSSPGVTLVTFDLDAVDQAAAPGVSAPGCGGIAVNLWLEAALQAGKSPLVRSVDIVELNPLFDVDHRTARLAALTLWRFYQGMCDRHQVSAGQR